jgi:phospholipid-transporting ATPase
MPNNDIQPLSADQVLLKGSILRNTDWCYGVACYTGHQTKVMKNSLKSRVKKSRIELQTNYYILLIVAIQLSVCALSALCNMVFTAKYESEETYIFAYFTLTNAQVYF